MSDSLFASASREEERLMRAMAGRGRAAAVPVRRSTFAPAPTLARLVEPKVSPAPLTTTATTAQITTSPTTTVTAVIPAVTATPPEPVRARHVENSASPSIDFERESEKREGERLLRTMRHAGRIDPQVDTSKAPPARVRADPQNAAALKAASAAVDAAFFASVDGASSVSVAPVTVTTPTFVRGPVSIAASEEFATAGGSILPLTEFHPCYACSQDIVGSYRGIFDRQYHESCFACTCGKRLDDDCYIEDDTAADLCCRDCYFKKFECQFCHQMVEGDFILEQDKLYHANCIATQCDACSQAITDDGGMLRAIGKKYHQHCFLCLHCQKPIQGAHQEVGGAPMCMTCFGDRHKTDAGNDYRQSNVVSDDQRNICPVCRNFVTLSGGAMQLQGKIYHTRCFSCHSCSCNLASDTTVDVFVHNNVVLCSKCKSSAVGTCVRCKNVLSGRYLDMGRDAKVHEACHQCAACDVALGNSAYILKGDKVLCADCGQTSACAGCKRCVSSGGYLEIGSDIYHIACFTCTGCQGSLVENDSVSYHEKDGKPYCSTCSIRI